MQDSTTTATPSAPLADGDRTARSTNRPAATTAPSDQAAMTGLMTTMLLVVAVRVCILCVGYASIHSADPAAVPQFQFEHPWIAWDARHYHDIAQQGYARDRVGEPFEGGTTFSRIAYFPLVPLVGRALSSVMRLDVALVTLSNLCALIGFGFLYDWARRLVGARAAAICVLIAATFPGAVSFAAGMTEGPFFMMVAITFWLLQQDRFYPAAIVVGLATATRPTGVALAIVVLLYAWLRTNNVALNKRVALIVALGAISFSGVICYQGFLWHRYHSPTAYSEAQSHWNRLNQERMQVEAQQGVKRYSWQFFRDRLFTPQAWNRGLALAILLVTVIGLIKPMGIPRIYFLLPLIILLMTALPGKGLRISSLPRYESGAIPLFLLPAIWLSANWRRAPVMVAVLLVQFGMQIYYAFLFPRQIWVG